jgi:hypothetical protein
MVQRNLKAIYAAFMAGIASTSTAYVSGNGHIGLVAGLTIAGAVVSAYGAVWGVTNAPAE